MASAEQREDTHDVIAHKYIYIWGMAIHKQFFKYYTLGYGAAIGAFVAILCLTNWWWVLASTTLTFLFIKNWLVGWSGLGLSILCGYIYYRVHRTHKREEQKQKIADDEVRKGLKRIGREEVM